MSERSSRYTGVAIALHWVIALAIIAMILGGWYMSDLPDGAPGQYFLYQLHKSVGITILTLTMARIIWRVMNPPPPLPTDMSHMEKLASHAVHLGFYGLMIALPLTGWLYVSTAYEFDVPTVLFGVISWPDIPGLGFLSNEAGHGAIEQVHSKLAWLVLGLLALHIAGALKHEFSSDEGVLRRMAPGLFGKTAPPPAPSRGALPAFGAALALFVVIAGFAALPSGQAELTPNTESDAPSQWAVDYDASYITFSGDHDGDTYTGGFANWSASITFDPDILSDARADVEVATGSVNASQKLYTDSLKAGEWLDPTGFPTARVAVTNFSKTSEGYRADAALTLKDTTLTLPLSFTLSVSGENAVMDGTTTLERTPFDIGQASDPGADWIGETVTIAVHVEASRNP